MGAAVGAELAIGDANEDVDEPAVTDAEGVTLGCDRGGATLAGRAGAADAVFVTVDVVEMVEAGVDPGAFTASRRRWVTIP